jgi:hypothetical protein
MKRVQSLALIGALAVLAACEDGPLQSKTPGEPAVAPQGVQAFVQVDNESAAPGDEVKVFVQVQMGSANKARIGSYTGTLKYGGDALEWIADDEINDGLRVTNPNAAPGEVRFAGASAGGFANQMLYAGRFRVKAAGYSGGLSLDMKELSAAATLGDLRPQMSVAPKVFLRAVAP